MATATVYIGKNKSEAEVVRMLLESNGIRASVMSGSPSFLGGNTGGMASGIPHSVLVDESDKTRAEEILNDQEEKGASA